MLKIRRYDVGGRETTGVALEDLARVLDIPETEYYGWVKGLPFQVYEGYTEDLTRYSIIPYEYAATLYQDNAFKAKLAMEETIVKGEDLLDRALGDTSDMSVKDLAYELDMTYTALRNKLLFLGILKMEGDFIVLSPSWVYSKCGYMELQPGLDGKYTQSIPKITQKGRIKLLFLLKEKL